MSIARLMQMAAAGQAGDYEISRSLRFNSSDSAYLSRTPASDTSSNKKGTFSCWIKISSNSGTNGGTILGATDNYYYAQFYQETFYFGNDTVALNTAAVFRDFSAWYHVLFVFDTTLATTNDRMQIWVNGVRQAVGGFNTQPSQDSTFKFLNTAQAYEIGRRPSGQYLNGYLADINFIDGQALTPSSFGETDAVTGVWKPIEYTGTYGTNGFYLPFSDNTSTTTLGYDAAGSNDWTLNNFSVTAGAGNDSLVDSPTRYGTDTQQGGEVRGNYCTLNLLNGTGTISNGNLEHRATTTTWVNASGTTLVSSGKWYWEVTAVGSSYKMIGVATSAADKNTSYGSPTETWTYREDATKYGGGNVGVSYGATFADGDVIGVALDLDAGTLVFYKNGSSQGTAFSSGLTGKVIGPWVGAYNSNVGTICNFGQRPFAHTAPSGFKALCTTNLPDPTILQGDDYFNTVLYNGNSGSNPITGVGFQPDLNWIKARNGVNQSHILSDAVRGTDGTSYYRLFSNLTNDESANNLNGVLSLDSDGFTPSLGGASVNQTGTTYVAWNWKANGAGSSNTAGTITSTVSVSTTSGFSIVSFVGNATGGATVGHGLGVVPKMIILKNRDATSSWYVYHSSLTTGSVLILETTAAQAASGFTDGTEPTSSVFSLGSASPFNGSGNDIIAYCFAAIPGFSAFGSYTGNGSTDGPFVYTGFRPAFIIIKAYNQAANWQMLDTARNPTNAADKFFRANSNIAEATNYPVDILSNGFKLRNTDGDYNVSASYSYIFMAFSSNPFKTSLAR